MTTRVSWLSPEGWDPRTQGTKANAEERPWQTTQIHHPATAATLLTLKAKFTPIKLRESVFLLS